mgnify:CR=1 FL=1
MGHLACQGFISIDGSLIEGSSASLERQNKTDAGAGGLYALPHLVWYYLEPRVQASAPTTKRADEDLGGRGP